MSDKHNQLIHHSRVIDLVLEQITLPNGHSFPLEIVHHPGGAAIVAINAQRQVCLVHQYRHVAQGELWELPAGKCNADEAPLMTARRELAEEAGLRAEEWQSLGTIWSSPGIFTERIHLYLARELYATAQQLEAEEHLEAHWVDFDQALAWAADGTLCDGKTIIGLFRAAHL